MSDSDPILQLVKSGRVAQFPLFYSISLSRDILAISGVRQSRAGLGMVPQVASQHVLFILNVVTGRELSLTEELIGIVS